MTKVECMALLGIVTILGLVGWATYFSFCECLKVGHSWLYCFMALG